MIATIELLRKQHAQALTRLADVEAMIGPNGSSDLTGFLAFLRLDLALHFSLEEEALFPILARHPHLAQGPVRVMNLEHAEFRNLVDRLDAAIRAGTGTQQSVVATEIIAFLRAHIAKEEHVLFPMAGRALSDDEQLEIDRRAADLSSAA